LTEAEIEVQPVESCGGRRLIRGEIEHRFGSRVVTGDGDAVAGRETIEEGVDRLHMTALEEVHGWAGFDEEQDLGGFVDVEEIRDGLLDAVIE